MKDSEELPGQVRIVSAGLPEAWSANRNSDGSTNTWKNYDIGEDKDVAEPETDITVFPIARKVEM